VKFLSIEPFLGEIKVYQYDLMDLDWLILGSQTQPVKHPELKWVKHIAYCAALYRLPLFVKEPLGSHYGINRKEFPHVL
jgi:protein gp37